MLRVLLPQVFVAYVYDEDDYMSTALGCCASPMTPSVSAGNATCSWNEECECMQHWQ